MRGITRGWARVVNYGPEVVKLRHAKRGVPAFSRTCRIVAMPQAKNGVTHFETALEDLEKIVEQLETGDLSLKESLQHFERGVKLARECQTTLKEAELKVSRLMEEETGEKEPEDNEDEKENQQ